MVKKILFFGLVFATLISGCKGTETPNRKIVRDSQGNAFIIPFEGLEVFIKYQIKTDNRTDLKALKSVFFTHKNGNTAESEAFVLTNGEVLKANMQKTINPKLQINYTFYFLKGVLTMAQASVSDQKKCINYHLFFNSQQSPIATYIQRIDNESTTEIHDFYICKAQSWLNRDIELSLKQLSDMQNQEGDFKLYFIGFSSAFNKEFIEFGNSNYSTNLAFIPQEKLVQQLKKTPHGFQNKSFFIQFEEITEASGFSYQLLTDIEMKD